MPKPLYLFFLLLASFLSLHPAASQTLYQSIGSFQDGAYARALTTPLHVVLPEPLREPELSKKYKKPAERTSYLAEIAAKRAALEAAAKHWHLSPVAIATAEEARNFELDKQGTHLMLSFSTVPVTKVQGTGRSYTYYFPALNLYLLGHVGGSHYLLQKSEYTSSILYYQLYYPFDRRSWPETYPATELVAAMQQLQAYMQQRAKGLSPREVKRAAEDHLGQSAALLPTKTLLLAREQLAKSLPESKLAKLYPYPVQLTDRAGLDAAIASASPQYVYVRYVTIESENGYQLLDASSGQVLGYCDFHGTHREEIGQVQDDDLKQLVKTAIKN